MAYTRRRSSGRTGRSTTRRSSTRRAPARRTTRRTSARGRASGGQTIRIVLEQPKPQVDVSMLRDMGLPASPSVPRKSKF